MDEFSKLLTAIAALVAALAWPAAVIATIFVFKRQLRLALGQVPIMLGRVKKASLAGVALELERVADAETATEPDKGGKITPRQLETAARIQTQDINSDTLLRELDRLCLEYDSLRRTLPSGEARTRAMTRVVVKMRTLAPSLVEFIDAYKGSGSPGSRLAAIAMMQMVPRDADLNWLSDRFLTEQQPFLLYHAALALQNVANVYDAPEEKHRILTIAKKALAKTKSFADAPDRGTIEVLETLISSLSEQ
jgi:hypothetical protein